VLTGYRLSVLEFEAISSILYAGSTLIYIPLVTYGALKLQLFDVDIRLKTTIRRSTLAAMFVALFFLVSEGANYFLSSMLGDVLGIVVAALLVFFLAPLSRWAEWVSTSLLSKNMQTSEYESYRKFQMYSTAVEETLALGEIGPSQEALLARLRESLNISNEDALKLREELGSPMSAV
jgi:ABC-type Fe3+-siderophore transport system permease subunit|tara:strand:- start:432 stop:965 length:534 start_codon:yes stop_codon:yes gene_type:complete